jgi:hypothetical protein
MEGAEGNFLSAPFFVPTPKGLDALEPLPGGVDPKDVVFRRMPAAWSARHPLTDRAPVTAG